MALEEISSILNAGLSILFLNLEIASADEEDPNDTSWLRAIQKSKNLTSFRALTLVANLSSNFASRIHRDYLVRTVWCKSLCAILQLSRIVA